MGSIALSSRHVGGVTVVQVSGSLDGANVAVLLGQLEPLLEDGARVVLDMRDVDYVSSAGWGTILHALGRGEQRRATILLCAMKPSIQRTFELLKLDTVFRHYGSQEEAVKSFDSNLT